MATYVLCQDVAVMVVYLLPVTRHGSRQDTSYAKDVVFMVTYVLCQDVVVMAADIRPFSRRRCHGGRRTSRVKTSFSW